MNSRRALRILPLAIALFLACAALGQETSWVGLTRAAVTEKLGQPQSNLRRGEREILVFASGERVELVGEQVVAHHLPSAGLIIGRDGTRYRSGADGRLTLERAKLPAAAEPEPIITVMEPEPESEPDEAVLPVNESVVEDESLEPAVDESFDRASLPEDESDLPGVEDLELDKLMEDLGWEEPEPPPPWAKGVTTIAGMTARFVIMFFVLQIALKWVGQPFYLPDVLKTSALYVVIRDGLHALGGLGDLWQMILLFRVDEIVGMLSLAVLLFKTEITRNGLTALKIAFATHLVTLGLMLAVGLALTFGLGLAY